jgi:glucans biosynthesis protein
LVEIPVREEFHDNIVTFWVSDNPLKVGESRTFAYRLRASLAPTLKTEPLGYIKHTRSSRDTASVPGTKDKPPPSLRRFIVEFAGGDLAMLAAAQPVKAELSVVAGEVSELIVQRLPGSEGWRVSFRLAPSGTDPIDMRLFLMLRDKRLTETWNYVWSPNEIN